jgi:hypothetical protein
MEATLSTLNLQKLGLKNVIWFNFIIFPVFILDFVLIFFIFLNFYLFSS